MHHSSSPARAGAADPGRSIPPRLHRRSSHRLLAASAALLGAALGTGSATGQTVCDSFGPDVVVGELSGVENYPSFGGIEAFAFGTTSCNIGDEELLWIPSSTMHPVISQNLYRIKDGRCEQVGQAWLKHGFAALQGNACGCGCMPSGTSQRLGVGCSDPYGASLNGSQNGLGPKFEVNAFTGEFLWPPTDISNTGNSIYKRLQVHIADLDPAQDGGGTYLIESQYVTPDDAAAANHFNNCSWREAVITGSGTSWSMSLTGITHREEPALLAWEQLDPTVNSREADVPGEGRFYVAWKISDAGGGFYEYELAVHNQNSDRSAGWLSVPLPAGTTVSSWGFHDVDYHSGEPYDGTDWPATISGSEIRWDTTPWSTDPDANALRWGTQYNFRFVADADPMLVDMLELGLFKPGGGGDPDSIIVPLLPGPPGNDDCADAVLITSGSTDYTTVSATTDGPVEPTCPTIESDVWFSYTSSCTGDVTVSLCGSSFDTSLAIYGPTCPAGPGEAIACNDNSCGAQSEVTFAATTGEMFLIRIGGVAGAQGVGAVTVSCDGIVENNDNCVDALPITAGDTPYDTTMATTDGPVNVGCQFDGQTYHDIWFAYIAPCNGDLLVSTCNQADYDTDLVVYDGCDCADLELLGCNDDGEGCSDFSSQVIVPVVEGGCYLIRVGGWQDGDQGTGTLTIVDPTCVPPTGPPNNNCADAIAVGEETISFSNVDATTDGPDEPEACNFFDYTDVDSDIWYLYTSTCAGTATVDLCGSGYDTKVAVYAGPACPTTASAIACNDDGCAFQSTLMFDTVAGGEYLIRIGGFQGAQGSGTMTISCDGDPITDCNGNGIDDAIDIMKGTSQDCNGNDTPDECDIAKGVSLDCDGGPVGVISAGAVVYTDNGCFGCHGADGSGGAGPSIQDYTRVQLWTKLTPPTDHGGGAFPGLTQQDYADLEAFLDTGGGSIGRPDTVPDDCQLLDDCDDDGVSDGCELDAGTQVDLDYDGIPDSCEPPCPADANHDNAVDVDDLTLVILGWGTADPDIDGDGDVDVDDLTAVILAWGPCP